MSPVLGVATPSTLCKHPGEGSQSTGGHVTAPSNTRVKWLLTQRQHSRVPVLGTQEKGAATVLNAASHCEKARD